MNKAFSSKGQVSFEFIVTVIMLLFVLGIGIFLFEDRALFNSNSARSWESQEVSHRIARNINNIYFLDGNATFTDYINWSGEGREVEFGDRVVMVWWSQNSFADSYLWTNNIDVLVTDFNGAIVFSKQNGRVIVRYP